MSLLCSPLVEEGQMSYSQKPRACFEELLIFPFHSEALPNYTKACLLFRGSLDRETTVKAVTAGCKGQQQLWSLVGNEEKSALMFFL